MVRVWLSRNARFEYWFSFKIRRRRSAKTLFRVWVFSYVGPKVVSCAPTVGLKLANVFGVFKTAVKLNQHPFTSTGSVSKYAEGVG